MKILFIVVYKFLKFMKKSVFYIGEKIFGEIVMVDFVF